MVSTRKNNPRMDGTRYFAGKRITLWNTQYEPGDEIPAEELTKVLRARSLVDTHRVHAIAPGEEPRGHVRRALLSHGVELPLPRKTRRPRKVAPVEAPEDVQDVEEEPEAPEQAPEPEEGTEAAEAAPEAPEEG